MIRLGASQMLLTNRDVTRTLKSDHPRRPPTFLYTKGRYPPITSDAPLSSPAPHLSTRRTTISPAMPSSSSSVITPDEVGPLDWSASSDSESTPSVILRHNRVVPTDGTQDSSNYVGGTGSLRQVISLETVDSFPFLPPRPNEIQIYEDDPNSVYEDSEPVSDTDFYDDSDSDSSSLEGTEYSIEPQNQDVSDSGGDYDIQYEEEDDDGEEESSMDDDSEGGHASVILVESIWDPNLTVMVPHRFVAPLLQTIDLQTDFQEDTTRETDIFETPPPRENLL
ncbi:hypothetical protein TWF694_011869 [Orbilia ellipsospora]|uniref:Uncharacterized protein n=1 Tax=Orbilia ellipsospora TaxID=2528407 RepID=A0AAV9X6J1_9PEZI